MSEQIEYRAVPYLHVVVSTQHTHKAHCKPACCRLLEAILPHPGSTMETCTPFLPWFLPCQRLCTLPNLHRLRIAILPLPLSRRRLTDAHAPAVVDDPERFLRLSCLAFFQIRSRSLPRFPHQAWPVFLLVAPLLNTFSATDTASLDSSETPWRLRRGSAAWACGSAHRPRGCGAWRRRGKPARLATWNTRMRRRPCTTSYPCREERR